MYTTLIAASACTRRVYLTVINIYFVWLHNYTKHMHILTIRKYEYTILRKGQTKSGPGMS